MNLGSEASIVNHCQHLKCELKICVGCKAAERPFDASSGLSRIEWQRMYNNTRVSYQRALSSSSEQKHVQPSDFPADNDRHVDNSLYSLVLVPEDASVSRDPIVRTSPTFVWSWSLLNERFPGLCLSMKMDFSDYFMWDPASRTWSGTTIPVQGASSPLDIPVEMWKRGKFTFFGMLTLVPRLAIEAGASWDELKPLKPGVLEVEQIELDENDGSFVVMVYDPRYRNAAPWSSPPGSQINKASARIALPPLLALFEFVGLLMITRPQRLLERRERAIRNGNSQRRASIDED